MASDIFKTKHIPENLEKNKILSAYGLDVKKSVDFCFDNKDNKVYDGNNDKVESNDCDKIYTWKQVINNAIGLDNTAISFIKMDPIKSKKFFLFFTSELNNKKLDEETKKIVIKCILDENVTKKEFRKILNDLCDNPVCKFPDNLEKINENGPLKLRDISLYILGNFTKIPRIIELSTGRLVSIVKTGELQSGEEIFTIRYGIKDNNVAYPKYKGISTFIVRENKVNFLDVIGFGEKNESRKDLEEIKEFIGFTMEHDDSIELNEVKRGKTTAIGEFIIDGINIFKTGLFKSKILDAGENDDGQKVLFVQTTYLDNTIFSQLEMNLFNENGKNIIYIGALGKDKIRIRFINAIPGLLSRIRDVYKKFDNSGKIEIRSFIATKDGKGGVMNKNTLSEAVNRYKPKK
ncbi:MAG: hypothetical protein PHV23_01115 [Candidatus Gracilibacteria bacterium]|nr:hypothetical protein [Candidatus Gracilibacteria bacterium]